MQGPGNVRWQQVTPELVADPVAAALGLAADRSARSMHSAAPPTDDVLAGPIDASVADTAQFCEHYQIALQESANCVVIAGKRGGDIRYAACVVLATTRADVNGAVRRRLDVRKASFAPMQDAVELTGMEYGGITPIGLPAQWPVLIDRAVLEQEVVVIGSGLRRSKLAVAPSVLVALPAAEVVDGLAG